MHFLYQTEPGKVKHFLKHVYQNRGGGNYDPLIQFKCVNIKHALYGCTENVNNEIL